MLISNEEIILMANGTNLNKRGNRGGGGGVSTKPTNHSQPMGMA